MPGGRPRKDGKRSKTPLRGKTRTIGGFEWRLVGYHPTPGALRGRVNHLNLATGTMTNEVVPQGMTVRQLFDAREKYWDDVEAGLVTAPIPPVDPAQQPADLAALGERYLKRLARTVETQDSVANRRSAITKWINPRIGHVLVADWTVDHSLQVLQHASAHTGTANVTMIRGTLKQMRDVAWSRIDGQRWLPRTEDPLEDIGFHLKSTIQGASAKYVEPHLRPSNTSLQSAITVAGQIGRWTWQPLCFALAGHCGPRLAEQLGLRVIDIDLRRREIDVNGRWKVTSGPARGSRRVRRRVPLTKNGKRRTTPYPGSIHDQLVQRIIDVLGLGAGAGEAEATAWIEAERNRRTALWDGRRGHSWRDWEVDALDEHWLFADETGVPPTKEMFNTDWRKVRAASTWPEHIPYRNMRHHACLWLFNLDADLTWVDIAQWTGHSHKTLEAFYVLPAEDSADRWRARFDEH